MSSMEIIILASIGFWLLQAVSMQFLVVNKPRWSILLALCIFLLGTLSLGKEILRVNGGMFNSESAILWVPFAMQVTRFVHALSVGGTKFANTFGLTSFPRVAAFTLFVPTVIFYDSDTAVAGDKANSLRKGFWILGRALLYVILFIVANTAILELDKLGFVELFPWWLERILSVYLLAISASLQDLLFNAPTRLLVGNCTTVIDICDNPIFISSPRDVWRRWTLCAGFHLRKGFYEPLGGSSNVVVATMVPFVVNTIIHIFWWSVATTGKAKWEYACPLFFMPLVTLVVDEHVTGPKGLFGWRRSSWKYRLVSYAQLLIVIVTMSPLLFRILELPNSLRKLASKNLNQPSAEVG